MSKRPKNSTFPASRIKRIMQADEDIGKVAQATPLVVSKALELFLADLCEAAAAEAKSRGAKKVSLHHIKRVVLAQPTFDFLKDLVEPIQDPGEAADGTKIKRKRAPKAEAAASEPAIEAGSTMNAAAKADDDEDYDD